MAVRQALDPYVNAMNLWVAPATMSDLETYWLERALGTIPASVPPPGAHLVQITQLDYSASVLGRVNSTNSTDIPITFFANGRKGILLSDALVKMFDHLVDAEELVGLLSTTDKVTYRIQVSDATKIPVLLELY
ncbi:hypothetical protein EIP86_001626 [Pleurotus ostreatoroseus]|nr:hypothetical protein EIP86_001626 [Pleurotus ostreatoroseus]